MLKTLYLRLTNQNKYAQASKLLSEGALILMGHKKVSEAIQIISDLICLWRSDPVDTSFKKERAQLLHQLFCMIPQSDTQNVHEFMQNVVEWVGMDEIDSNMMPIYKSYGVNLWNLKKFHHSSTAFVRQSDCNKMTELFAEWSQKSTAKERPYFLTRIVLQYLCVRNVDGCRSFIDSVCPVLSFPILTFRNCFTASVLFHREMICEGHRCEVHWRIFAIYCANQWRERALFCTMWSRKHICHCSKWSRA